jgi:hypothetical protein
MLKAPALRVVQAIRVACDALVVMVLVEVPALPEGHFAIEVGFDALAPENLLAFAGSLTIRLLAVGVAEWNALLDVLGACSAPCKQGNSPKTGHCLADPHLFWGLHAERSIAQEASR